MILPLMPSEALMNQRADSSYNFLIKCCIHRSLHNKSGKKNSFMVAIPLLMSQILKNDASMTTISNNDFIFRFYVELELDDMSVCVCMGTHTDISSNSNSLRDASVFYLSVAHHE